MQKWSDAQIELAAEAIWANAIDARQADIHNIEFDEAYRRLREWIDERLNAES